MSFVGDNMMDQILHFETKFPQVRKQQLKRERERERARLRLFKISIETGI